MKSILPERITIKLHDAYASTKRSLEAFNTYIQSKDLQKLIEEMDDSQYFQLWQESLTKALKEAEKSK